MYRQYSITNNEDIVNILNGRCPDYALDWNETNLFHWPNGHDYYLGNKSNETISSNMELREILSERLMKKKITNKLIFCNLDGILANVKKIKKYQYEFKILTWTERGEELWNKIKDLNPIILLNDKSKYKWCKKNLGKDIKMLYCSSREKEKFCLRGSILIDDSIECLDDWKEKGGEFVLYTEDNLEDVVERINQSMKTI